MMVGAEVGDCPHLGILILLLGLVVLFSHIVDMSVVIGLALGIHHWSIVSLVGVALLLHVPLLLAVATGNVGVPGTFWSSLGELAWRSFSWVEIYCSWLE